MGRGLHRPILEVWREVWGGLLAGGKGLAEGSPKQGPLKRRTRAGASTMDKKDLVTNPRIQGRAGVWMRLHFPSAGDATEMICYRQTSGAGIPLVLEFGENAHCTDFYGVS